MPNPPVPSPSGAAQEYDFAHESRRVCEAIGSNIGWMTVQCALREAYAAGLLASQHQLREALHALEQEMRALVNQWDSIDPDYLSTKLDDEIRQWADQLAALRSTAGVQE